MTTGYSTASLELTRSISMSDKKAQGIFFTPPSVVKTTINLLRQILASEHPKHLDYDSRSYSFEILEPSCGSGEFIDCLSKLPVPLIDNRTVSVRGIENNPTICERVKKEYAKVGNVRIEQADFLTKSFTSKGGSSLLYDLIIGNPPYFVMKKSDVPSTYYPFFEGRPNIFIIFILKCIHLLKNRGLLAFVLPKNFLNCLYYDKTRKFIVNTCKIINIVDCDALDTRIEREGGGVGASAAAAYLDTKQPTILLIIQKTSLTHLSDTVPRTVISPPGTSYTIFSTSALRISELYKGSTSLAKMGFKVTVGNVVWNQQKSNLVNIASDRQNVTSESVARLIYSSDIVNNQLTMKVYKNAAKRNYIRSRGLTGPMLLINRGYGVGNYKFAYCLLNEPRDFHYLIENHLMCIAPTQQHRQSLTDEQLIAEYKKIIASLEDQRTSEFIGMYFNNSAINTTELNHVLPIY